ncbi:lactonase family protein [Salegentibacter flavus]|uniref:6-phosphogluconolactonase n=1 Tax=Salegentibacter flavus TaxID=287099 RepID=A0A1I5CGN0_9FLAO|nr:lactonase family protein [Salegentibacter flavus]SFN86148.1 6-phosphogluconolactonase [Salegentibacter flavus]
MVINKMKFLPVFLFGLLSIPLVSQNPVYIGTYTKTEGHVDGKANGVYLMHQDAKTGDLSDPVCVAEVINPSFVKTSSDGKNLYAVSELAPGDGESGYIYSFSRNADNSLEELGKISTESFAPCHIEIDQSGKYVFVSNYVGGVVMLYERDEKGNLQKKQKIELENPKASHPHSVSISKDNKFAYINDLGNDKVWIYNFDAETGKLTPKDKPYVELEEGAGPRHFSFSKDEEFAYTINELNSSLSVFKKDSLGGLSLIKSYPSLPENFDEKNFTADIHLHPNGNFLYASNRGHNSIAAFQVNKESGKLILIGHYATQGEFPRNFAISPDGNFLYAANQNSDNISIFRINKMDGKLIPHLEPAEVKTPVCIEFAK